MLLEARDLCLGYGAAPVVKQLALSFEPGSVTAVIGANGSGKSTILKALARVLAPSDGAVYRDGRARASWRPTELARRLAVLPQVHGVPDDLTVRELVRYGRFPHRGAPGNDARTDGAAVERALGLASLTDLAERPLSSLSGGERQRAWLALALAQEPRVLLLDEPTTYLDVRYQFEVLDLVASLNRDLGITVIMVLHDLNHAARYSGRVVALRSGRVVADGPPSGVLTEATLERVFGVEGIVTMIGGYPYFIATGRSDPLARAEPGTSESGLARKEAAAWT